MPRDLDPTFAASLSGGLFGPVLMVMLTFRSQTVYAWSGVGNLVWNGNTYLGVGSLGKVGAITEGSSVKADGTSVQLSGIDANLLGECLTDIELQAPAKVWFGCMLGGVLIGTPFLIFSGTMDKPSFSISGDTATITIALENRMLDNARANQLKYTWSDQRVKYPDDTGFYWVPVLNDIALQWG